MAKKARASQVKGIDIGGLNNILQLAVQVGNELDQIEIPYCFIGGTAYQRWGEPRQTTDVDATLLVDFGKERILIHEELVPLAELKEEPEIVEQLTRLFKKHSA